MEGDGLEALLTACPTDARLNLSSSEAVDDTTIERCGRSAKQCRLVPLHTSLQDLTHLTRSLNKAKQFLFLGGRRHQVALPPPMSKGGHQQCALHVPLTTEATLVAWAASPYGVAQRWPRAPKESAPETVARKPPFLGLHHARGSCRSTSRAAGS